MSAREGETMWSRWFWIVMGVALIILVWRRRFAQRAVLSADIPDDPVLDAALQAAFVQARDAYHRIRSGETVIDGQQLSDEVITSVAAMTEDEFVEAWVHLEQSRHAQVGG